MSIARTSIPIPVLAWAALVLLASASAAAVEYRVETIKEAPGGELSAEIAAQLSPTGLKVLKGEKRVVCEIWPARQWTVQADLQPSETVLYPLEPGTLVGVLRFARLGADFRDQEIPAGVYTLRYAYQPVDGNHVGTFETRDFLLLLPASADRSSQPIAEMELSELSALSAESTHPAILPLIKAEPDATPALRHLEEQDWWTLRLAGKDAQGGELFLELIVVGKAAE